MYLFRNILMLFFLMSSMFISAQNLAWNYDSLFRVMNTSKVLENKQYACALYANKHFGTNPDSVGILLKMAAPITKSKQYQAIADYYIVIGLYKWYSNDIDSSMFYLKKSYNLGKSKKYERIFANSAVTIGMLFKIKGNFDSASYYLKQSISTAEKIHNRQIENKGHYDLAGVYVQSGKYELALTHYLNALKLQEMEQDSFRILYTYNGLGTVYQNLKKKDKSKSYYLKSMKMDSLVKKADIRITNMTNLGLLYESNFKNIDSALFYYNLAMKLLPDNDKSLSKISLLVNIGNSYIVLKEYQKALSNYNKCLSYNIENMNTYAYSAILINKSLIYYYLKNYDSVYYLAEKGLKLAEDIEAIDWQIQAHKNLYQTDSITGRNISAFKHLQMMHSLSDTIYNTDNLNRISELEIIYETKKKDELNKSLSENNDLYQQIIKSQKLIIISVSLATILFILLIINILRSNRKKKITNNKLHQAYEEIKQKNKEIDEKNTQLTEKNIELTKLIETKDKFFSVISHDLRGPFNSILGFLDILNSEFEDLIDVKKKEMLSQVQKSSQNTYNLLVNLLDWARAQRGIIENNAEKLETFVIVQHSISQCYQRAENKEIKIINETDPNIFVWADGNLFSSVLQNLLNNAVKFSPRGSQININCKIEKDMLVLLVTDQGIGIPKENQPNLFNLGNSINRKGTENELGTGLGLVLVNEFVQLLGGKIWVESSPNGFPVEKGTTFGFTVPLYKSHFTK